MNETTKKFIREHLNDDVPTLALKKAPVGIDFSLALRQIEARQLLQKKVPEWSQNDDLLFPARLSIEQCSSEATARYKANLMQGHTFADLTGGLGIDTYYLSQGFRQTHYVERQTELCDLARHNFAALGVNVEVHNVTAEDYLEHISKNIEGIDTLIPQPLSYRPRNEGVYLWAAPIGMTCLQNLDWIYLDPARRDANGRKTVCIGDCTPNVAEMQDLLLQKVQRVMVKLSPMLDISKALAELRCVSHVHVIAVNNECKELVFIMERNFSGQPTVHCANLLTPQPTLVFTFGQEHDCQLHLTDEPRRYLYEPNAALMKAGAYKWVAEHYRVLKLHKNSHLYTSETLVADFPGRIFEVEAWADYNKKVKSTLLADVDKANLAVRNFPLSVDELRKALKMGEGGEVYLFGTTLRNGRKVVIKTKKSASF